MSTHTTSAPVITLATRVTLIRIAGIPVFAVLLLRFFATGDAFWRWVALGLFILIVSTDALDGWLARSRGEESPLGKFLDPLADKLLMLAAIALLTRPYDAKYAPQFPLFLALLILARELFLGIGYGVIRRKVGTVQVLPRESGKAATFLLACLVALLLWPAAPQWVAAASWITGICFAVSWLHYLRDGLAQMR